MSRGYSCFKSILCGSHKLCAIKPIHKMIRYSYEGDLKQVSQGTITMIIIFLVISVERALVQLETN